MPITFTPYYYNDKLMGAKENAGKTQVAPQLSVSYFLTARLQATLSGGIAQREVDEQNFYQGCDRPAGRKRLGRHRMPQRLRRQRPVYHRPAAANKIGKIKQLPVVIF